jgi:maleate isomerase
MLDQLPVVRARVGLIIPSSNRLTEPQMHHYAPAGVQIHVTRLRMTGPHHVGLDQLMPRIVEATGALADARCDVIVFHCTASSMESGLDGEQSVVDAMRSATDGQVLTTATATRAALEGLGVRRIVLISPYVAATHRHEVDFLVEAGFDVVGDRCLGLGGGDEYVQVTPAEWLAIGRSELRPGAQGVFLSCTNIRAPEIIRRLEGAVGVPVVTSNQAVLWYCLRTCGLSDDIPELGRLLQVPVPATAPQRLSTARSGATIDARADGSTAGRA